MCVSNGINFGCLRALGYTLLVTSILSIGLTIADILATYFMCPPSGNGDVNCLPEYEGNVWTWIASGIWTSVPVFILGLWIIGWTMNMSRPGCFHDWFLGLTYFVLVPLMISLTITEAVQYRKHFWWGDGQFNKLPIPITLTVIGFIEMTILFFIFNEINCKRWSDEYIDEQAPTTETTTTTTTTTPVPVITTSAITTPVNVVYPNVSYAKRIQTAVVPAYGIYSPNNYYAVRPQGMRWNSPLFNYPQTRIAVVAN